MFRFILSFIVGFVIKTVDLASEHGLKLSKKIEFVLAILYGILLALMIKIVFLPEFFLGISLGVLVSGKIDSKSHQLAYLVFVIFCFIFNVTINNWLLVLLTVSICFFEEWINDNVVDKKLVKGFLLKFLSVRPVLEITSIILSIVYFNVEIFLMLFLFDIGYLSSKKYLTPKQ